jgi:hypothetical protein
VLNEYDEQCFSQRAYLGYRVSNLVSVLTIATNMKSMEKKEEKSGISTSKTNTIIGRPDK